MIELLIKDRVVGPAQSSLLSVEEISSTPKNLDNDDCHKVFTTPFCFQKGWDFFMQMRVLVKK